MLGGNIIPVDGLKPFSVPALTYEQYGGQRYCT